jgi:hypothetical protein
MTLLLVVFLLTHLAKGNVSFCHDLFGKVVSEEKIFRNQPIRNKNCLWRPCLLMDREEMSSLYAILVSDWSISKNLLCN